MFKKLFMLFLLSFATAGIVFGCANNEIEATSLHAYVAVKDKIALQEAFALLHSGKVDIDEQDSNGNTFLHHALYHLDKKPTIRLVAAVVRRGALPNIPNKKNKTAHMLAREWIAYLRSEKNIHESDPLHGDSRLVENLDRQIKALTFLYCGMTIKSLTPKAPEHLPAPVLSVAPYLPVNSYAQRAQA